MKTPSERFRDRLHSLDEEMLAEIDRRVGEHKGQPPNVQWRDDPDPFGMDWRWLYPPRQKQIHPAAPPIATTASPPPPPPRSVWMSRLTGIAAALLAGLALGWALFRAGDPQQLQILAASGTAGYVTARGAEELQVRVESPFAGFAALIALAPGRKPQVYPPFGADDIPVPEGAPSEPVTIRDGTIRVLAVITPTPPGETVRGLFDDDPDADFEPEDIEDLQEEVQQLLESKGYRLMAFADIPVEEGE